MSDIRRKIIVTIERGGDIKITTTGKPSAKELALARLLHENRTNIGFDRKESGLDRHVLRSWTDLVLGKPPDDVDSASAQTSM